LADDDPGRRRFEATQALRQVLKVNGLHVHGLNVARKSAPGRVMVVNAR